MENNPNPNWERQALEHLLLENLKETRKARRWKAVLRVLTLVVIVGVILSVFDFHLPGRGMGTEKHTAMVTLEGEISSSSMANALDINSSLVSAFERSKATTKSAVFFVFFQKLPTTSLSESLFCPLFCFLYLDEGILPPRAS